MLYKIAVVFLLGLYNHGKCSDFKQERAKVMYCNPKYMKDLVVLTVRPNRYSPYVTNLNVTTLQTIGNNVTWRFEFSSAKLSSFPLAIDFKSCDGVNKLTWLREWLKTYSNIPFNDCPVRAGNYYFRNLEFPPKNFPLQFNKVDYAGKILVFVTATKEKIADISINLVKTKGKVEHKDTN